MRKWLTPTSNIGFCLQIIAMANEKKKCNHIIGVFEKYYEKKNITESEFEEELKRVGKTFAELSYDCKDDKKRKKSFCRDLHLQLEYPYPFYKEVPKSIFFPIDLYAYCPLCGKKMLTDEERMEKATEEMYKVARSLTVKDIEKIKQERAEEEKNKGWAYIPTAEKKPVEQNGYVYVIKMENSYKIGISKTPKSRLQAFTSLPYKVDTIMVEKVIGYDKREKELHEHFADKRVRGEWFELNEEDIEYIKKYLKSYKEL